MFLASEVQKQAGLLSSTGGVGAEDEATGAPVHCFETEFSDGYVCLLLCVQGVELPCDEPPISPPLSIPPFVQGVGDGHAHSHEDVNDHSASEKDTLSHTSCTPATNLSRAVHNHDHNSLFAQPELQVRDLLTTRIVEAEVSLSGKVMPSN